MMIPRIKTFFCLLSTLWLLSTCVFAADIDNDSMEDTWEPANGYVVGTAELDIDADGDRISNRWELAFGTIGSDAASKPVYAAIQSMIPKYYIVDGTLAAETTYEKKTITAAITAAVDLSIIEIKPGTYTENLTIPSGKRLTIFSTQGARRTIINGNLTPAAQITLDGLFIDRRGLSSVDAISYSGNNTQGVAWFKNCIVCGGNTVLNIRGGGPAKILHCTLAGGIQYGLLSQGNSLAEAHNSIIWGSGSLDLYNFNGTLRVSHSLYASGKIAGGITHTSNLALTPAQTPGYNPSFQLRSDSFARNIGVIQTVNSSDADNEIRNNSPADLPDAGADEFIDSDSDGIPDWMEALGATEPSGDADNDGATNLAEYQAGTDTFDADTDNDSMKDGYELARLAFFNPFAAEPYEDPDGDHFPNLWEATWGTDGGDANSKPASAAAGPAGSGNYYVVDPNQSGADTTYARKLLSTAITAAGDLGIIELKAGSYPVTNVTIPSGKRLLIFSSAGARRTVFTSGFLIYSPSVIDGIGFDNRGAVNATNYIELVSYGIRVRNCVMRGGNSGIFVGFYPSGSGSSTLGASIAEHCAIIGNTHGIVMNNSYPLTLVNTICAANISSDAAFGSSLARFESCVVGLNRISSAFLDSNTLRFDTTATSPVLPIINSLGLASGLGLQGNSPLINKGRLLASTIIDYDAETRPNNSVNLPDIGADEFFDSDSDNIPDWMEALGANDPLGDADSDGATNLAEFQAGTNPFNADTDGDSVKDGYELARLSLINPFVQEPYEDPDGDHFPNLWEVTWATDGGDANSKPTPGAGPAGSGGYYTIDPALSADATYEKRLLPTAITAVADVGIIELKAGQHLAGNASWSIPSNKRLLVFSEAGPRRTLFPYAGAINSMSVIDGIGFDNRGAINGLTYLNPNADGIRIRNCVMRGGAVGVSKTSAGSIVEHCTITGNTVGVGMNTSIGSSMRLINCIVAGNVSSDSTAYALTVFFESSVVGLGRFGSAVVDANCLRLDTTATNPALPVINGLGLASGLGLQGNSPLINKGRLLASFITDLDGELRTNSLANLPDIGSDEFNDADADGLPDWLEALGASAPAADADNDGATNLAEVNAGTDVFDADTDNDSMKDGYELARAAFFNPFVQEPYEDPDGDHFPNLWEVTWATDGGDANSKPTPGAGPAGSGGYYTIDPALSADATYEKRLLPTAITAVADVGIIELKAGQHLAGNASWSIPSNKRLLVFSEAGPRRTLFPYAGAINSMSVIDGIGFDNRGAINGLTYLNPNADGIRIRNCVMRGGAVGVSKTSAGSIVEHCTITGNTVGVGMNTSIGSSMRLINCIVAGNVSSDSTAYALTVFFESSVVGLGRFGSAVVDANCLRLDTTATNPALPVINGLGLASGLGLLGNSPLINKGRVLASFITDLDGELRTNSLANLPDIGSDEFNDADADGLPDWLEALGASAPAADADNDGATNLAEVNAGTDVFDADTDNDSMKDGYELARAAFFNPFVQEPYEDPDGDHFPNLWEVTWATDGGDANSKPSPGAGPAGSGGYYTIDPALSADATYEKRLLPTAITTVADVGIIELKAGQHLAGNASWSIPSNKRLLVFSEAGPRRTLFPYAGAINSMSVIDGIGFDNRGAINGLTYLNPNADGIRIRNCVMRGGAVGVSKTSAGSIVEHCTITGNTVGVGMNTSIGSSMRLINCIVAGNVSSDSTAYALTVFFESSVVGLGRFGSAVVDANCLRLDTTAASPALPIINNLRLRADLHLWGDSPLRHKGRVIASAVSDFDGEERPNTAIDLPDMGADEFIDSDADSVPDWVIANAGGDEDADGLTTPGEWTAGTDSLFADTDGDGMRDGYEVTFGLAPFTVADAMEDPDGDRVPNFFEALRGTSPIDGNSPPVPDLIIDGSQSAAGNRYQTFAAAIAAASDWNTVQVRPGTYTENISIPANKRLMFYSSAGAKTTILRPSTASTDSVTILGGAVFDGFTITANGNTGNSCVTINGTSNSMLRNCTIFGRGVAINILGSTGYVFVQHCTCLPTSSSITIAGASARVLAVNSALRGVLTTSATNLTLDTCLYTPASPTATLLNTNYRELSTYTGSDPTILVNAGINADGSLAANSPLINKGRVLTNAGPLIDFDGLPRSNTASDLPDIGVDESSDTDGDGLPDWWETIYFGNLAQIGSGNSDNDGLSNTQEIAAGTNPILADTDADGITDGDEITQGRNPRIKDIVGTLSITPTPDLYSTAQIVTITCAPESDATIRYTTDGTVPTTRSPIYTAPLSITATTRVRAQGFKLSFTPTPTIDAGYGIHADAAQLPSGGVKLWLRSDEGITLDGSNNVQQWDDLSGQRNHVAQASSTKRPTTAASTLSGKLAVRFDGSDDVLANSSVTTFPTRYVSTFVVSRSAALAANAGRRGVLSWWTSGSPYEFGISVDPAQTLGFAPFRRSNPFSASAQTGFPPFVAPVRTSDQFDAVVVSLNSDTQQFKLHRQGADTLIGAGHTGYNNLRILANGSLAVGSLLKTVSSAATPDGYLSGDVAEILVYDRLLSDTEIAQLQAWYVTRFGETLLAPQASRPADSYANSVSITLSTASPNADIRYTTDGSQPTETSSLFATTAPIVLNTHGTHTLKARAFRSGANPSGTTSFVYVIDAQPPAVTNPRLNDLPLAANSTLTAGGVFKVDASDGSGISQVQFFFNDQLVASDTTANDGYSFSWRPSGVTPDGAHTFTFRAYDRFQVSTDLVIPFTFGLAVPAAPAFTLPAADSMTNEESLVLTGTAAANSLVKVYRNGAQIQSNLGLDGSGRFQLSVVLDQGPNVFTAKAYFREGQLSEASTPRTITYDSNAPTPPVGVAMAQRPNGVLRLDWTPAARGTEALGYHIYRATAPFDSSTGAGVTRLTTTALLTTTYQDGATTGINTELFYRLSAVDNAGNESLLSALVSAAPDRSGPTAFITYDSAAYLYGTPEKYGNGPLTVKLVFSEPLNGVPYVAMRAAGQSYEPLVLTPMTAPQGATGPAYTTTWQITPAKPSGSADIAITTFDLAGNAFAGATLGASVLLDTQGPIVNELDLPAGVRNNPATPAVITLHAVLNEPSVTATGVVEAPVFTYTLATTSPTTPLPITVTAGQDHLHWTLQFTLPSTAGATAELLTLAVTARDQLGNANASFLRAPIMEIYQNDPEAPAVPANLTAASRAGGMIQLAWRSAAKATGYRLLRGTQADGSDLTVIAAASSLSFDDLPPADGTYYYAVEAIRQIGTETSTSGQSTPLVLGSSDRTSPGSPQNLALALLPQGIRATWVSSDSEAASFKVYRAASTISTLSGLTALRSGLSSSPFTDANATSAESWYSVSAVDAAGNESAPSTSQRLNVGLLPVASMTVRWAQDATPPTLTWTPRTNGVNGYQLRVYPNPTAVADPNASPVLTQSIAGATTSSFTDTSFPGTPPRSYTLSTQDGTGEESLKRILTLPDATYTTDATTPLLKGALNRVPFQVRAGTVPLIKARIEVRLASAPASPPWFSETFQLAAGASRQVQVSIPGSESLPESSVALSAALVECPNENECASLESSLTLPVVNLALKFLLKPAGFVKGGIGRASFEVQNPTSEPLELIVAKSNGSQPSSELRFLLQDRSTNTLVTKPLKFVTGENIFQLANGDTVLRIAPLATITAPETTISVPTHAPDDLVLFLEGDRTWFHRGQADEVGIDSGFKLGVSVNAAATVYDAVIQSATVHGTEPKVVLSGVAKYRPTNSVSNPGPAGKQPITITIAKPDGSDALINVVTEEDGTFSHTYEHPAREISGLFTAWAMHPDRRDRESQVSFAFSGVSLSQTSLTFATPGSFVTPLTFQATAARGTAVSNLRFQFVAADQPNGVASMAGISLTSGSTALASGETKPLILSFSGLETAARSGRLTGKLVGTLAGETSTRVFQVVTLDYSLTTGKPIVITTPTYLQTGVNPGKEVLESIEFENSGFAPLIRPDWRLTSLTGTAAPEWAQLLTAPPAGENEEIAIGGKQAIHLRFAPPESTAPGLYQMRLRIAGSNLFPIAYTIFVEVTESGSGNLAVQVVDAFSPSDGVGGWTTGVAGAKVSYTNEDVPTITGTATVSATTPNGIVNFSDLPAGPYKLRVEGPKHTSVIRRLRLRPGITLSENVQLPYNGVKLTWEVVEKTITDTYEVVADIIFETNVPVASVIASPVAVNLPDLAPGEIFQGEVTFTNVGMIIADDFKFTPPPNLPSMRIDIFGNMPKRFLPGEQVKLVYRVTALKPLFFTPGAGGFGAECVLASLGRGSYCYNCANGTKGCGGTNFAIVKALCEPKQEDDGGKADGNGDGSLKNLPDLREEDDDNACAPRPLPPPNGSPKPVLGGLPKTPVPYDPSWLVNQKWPDPDPLLRPDLFPGLQPPAPPDANSPFGILPGAALIQPLPDSGISTYGSTSGARIYADRAWVDLVQREYQDRLLDLKAATAKGYIYLCRDYYGNAWRWKHETKLERILSSDAVRVDEMKRNRVIYEPVNSARRVFLAGRNRIEKEAAGTWLWTGSNREWERYDSELRLIEWGVWREKTGTVTWVDGLPDQLCDAAGNCAIDLTYNASGQLASAVSTSGASVQYAYTNGFITRFTDAAGLHWDYVYDGEGRMVKRIHPDSSSIELDLNGNGAPKKIKGLLQGLEDYYYNFDQSKEVHYARIKHADGTKTERWFDRNAVEIRRLESGVLQFESSVSADGMARTWTDGADRKTTHHYNEAGQVIQVDHPDGTASLYEYSPALGLVTSLTDPRGIVTRASYDNAGRVLSIIENWATDYQAATTFTYYTAAEDAANVGRLKSITDPRGLTLRREYTTAADSPVPTGLLKRIYDTADPQTQTLYAYGVHGGLTSVTDALGHTTRYLYDSALRLTHEIAPGRAATIHSYDAISGRLALTETGCQLGLNDQPINGQRGRVLERKYDLGGRLVETYRLPAPGSATRLLVSKLTFDAAGREVTRTDALGYTTRTDYDNKGRLLTSSRPMPQSLSSGLSAPTNAATTYLYDSAGRLFTVMDPMRNLTLIEYDGAGRPFRVTEAANSPLERATENVYGGYGQVLETRYSHATPTGATLVTKRDFDLLGRVTRLYGDRVTDTVTTYDNATGDITSTTTAGGLRQEYGYDRYGRRVITRLPAFAARAATTDEPAFAEEPAADSLIEYDRLGRVIAKRDPAGRWTYVAYNAAGQEFATSLPTYRDLRNSSGDAPEFTASSPAPALPVTLPPETAQSGSSWWADTSCIATLSVFDRFGQLTSITTAGKGTESCTYDDLGRCDNMTTADGWLHSYSYDAGDQLQSTHFAAISADHAPTSELITYDSINPHLRATETDRQGATTRFLRYDLLGRLTAKQQASGARESLSFDALGRLVATTLTPASSDANAAPRVTSMTYDRFDQLLTTTLPDHVAGSTVGAARYRLQNRTYGAQGQLLTTTGADVFPATYTHDADGRVATMTDGKNAVTRYFYNPRGQLTRKILADASRYDFTYHPDGSLKTRLDAKNQLTRYTTHLFGQPSLIDYPSDTDVSTTFDTLGRATSRSDDAGTWAFAYDPQGRLSEEYHPHVQRTLRRSYGLDGYQTTLTLGAVQGQSFSAERSITYQQDSPSRLTSVTDSATASFSYTWNPAHRAWATLSRPGGSQLSRQWDSLSQLTAQRTLPPNGTSLNALESWIYTYTTAGQRSSETTVLDLTALPSPLNAQLTSPTTRGYGYNAAVVGAIGTGGTSFTFDSVGARSTSTQDGVTTTYLTNALGQYTQITTGGIARSLTYDLNGNLTSDGEGRSLAWTQENRLARISDTSSTVGAGGRTSEFRYDASARRIESKHSTGTTTLSHVQTIRYLYDGANVIAEYTSQTPLSSQLSALSLSSSHTWGLSSPLHPSNAALLASKSAWNAIGASTPSTTQTILYPSYDGSSSVSLVTDANSAVKAAYRYDPFGKTTYAGGDTSPVWRYRYRTLPVETWTSGDWAYSVSSGYYSPGLGSHLSWPSSQEEARPFPGTYNQRPTVTPPTSGIDSDDDGIPDEWENSNFGSIVISTGDTDTDKDGLSDQEERKRGTNPSSVDSDGDSITDGREIAIGGDPNDEDTDDDGVRDDDDVFILYKRFETNQYKAGFKAFTPTQLPTYYKWRDYIWTVGSLLTPPLQPDAGKVRPGAYFMLYNPANQRYSPMAPSPRNQSHLNVWEIFDSLGNLDPAQYRSPITETQRNFTFPISYVGTSVTGIGPGAATGVVSGTEALSLKYTTDELIQNAVTALDKQIEEAEKKDDYEETWIPFREGVDDPDKLIAKAELSADEAKFTLSEVRLKPMIGSPTKIRTAITVVKEELSTSQAEIPPVVNSIVIGEAKYFTVGVQISESTIAKIPRGTNTAITATVEGDIEPVEINSLDRFVEMTLPSNVVTEFGGVANCKVRFYNNAGESYEVNLSTATVYQENPDRELADEDRPEEGVFFPVSECKTPWDGLKPSLDATPISVTKKNGSYKFRTCFDRLGEIRLAVSQANKPSKTVTCHYKLIGNQDMAELMASLENTFRESEYWNGVSYGTYDPNYPNLPPLPDTLIFPPDAPPFPLDNPVILASAAATPFARAAASGSGWGFSFRNVVAKCCSTVYDTVKTVVVQGVVLQVEAVKIAVIGAQGFVKGFWAGVKSDAQSVTDFADMIAHPIDTAKSLYEGFRGLCSMSLDQLKSIPKKMLEEYLTSAQKDIAWAEPTGFELTVYTAGYSAGYLVEQIAMTALKVTVLAPIGFATLATTGGKVANLMKKFSGTAKVLGKIEDMAEGAQKIAAKIQSAKNLAMKSCTQFVKDKTGLDRIEDLIKRKLDAGCPGL